jgi:UDP-galactopyranose mutase
MGQRITVKCNWGHEHVVEAPDDLISIADASRRADRAISTIMTHIYKGNIKGYDIVNQWGHTKTYVSQAEIDRLYPQEVIAS